MEKKILVKKTGEILTTPNNEFEIKRMSFSFKFDLEDSVKDKTEEKLTYTQYYTADNGETYHESEVIVGLDEIREYKIENNLEI